MYRTIYVPVDNSDHSNAAIDLALKFGKAFQSSLVGSHVYAAKLHDVRFKQMEFTLPDEYKEDTELEKQRKIHDALIGRGLHLISDSYLDRMDASAKEAQLTFERKHFDGKNFEAIVDDVRKSGYDLVILGALGQGAVKDSLVGSVVERTLRRTDVDTLVVRDLGAEAAGEGTRLAVCFDGSAQSYAALTTACHIARSFDKHVEILTAQDPDSEDAALMRAHLEIAERHAHKEGVRASSRLLAISAAEESARAAIAAAVKSDAPWLLVVGRSGIDASADAASIGSFTEHLVRHAPCNVLICARPANSVATPPTG